MRAKEEGQELLTYEQAQKIKINTTSASNLWKQYCYEVEDWYLLNKLTKIKLSVEIKLNKKHKQNITLYINLFKVETTKLNENDKWEIFQNVILIFIIDVLTPRKFNEENLIQQALTRHALITETITQIEKLFVYNNKLMSKEQKKSYVLLIMSVIDELVKLKYLKQETTHCLNKKKQENFNEVLEFKEEEPLNMYINPDQTDKIKTIYLYSITQSTALTLNMNYWNVAIIPLTQLIQEQGTVYQMGATLKSLHKITLENKFSNKHINLEDITILTKLKELKAFINIELYDLIKTTISLDKTELSVNKVIVEIKQNIKQLKLPIYKHKINFNKTFSVDKWATNKKIKTLQKIINKQLILLDFLILGECKYMFNQPLYFYFMFDFRGRLYYKSKISPQNTYLFRYIYDYGPKNRNDTESNLPLTIDYQHWYNFIKQSIGFTITHKEAERRVIFWLVIEWAKLQKNERIEELKGCFSISDFISLGLQTIYKSDTITVDIEKKVQFKYIKFIWEEIITTGTLSRYYIIYKDATASAIQLLTVYLLPIDENISKHTNLESYCYWYDTYFYIIQSFKQTYNIDEVSQNYFNRNNLKKTIMTYNYSATLFTCWKEFELTIINQKNSISNEEIKKIKIDFTQFYKYLDNLFNKQNIYKHSLDSQTQKLLNSYAEKNQITIKSTDQATIHLHYLVINSKRWTIQNQNNRKTIQMTELGDKLDIKKTKQSLKPNTTHAMDAALIREVLRDMKYPIITIHDCYGIPIYEIDTTIYSINKNINKIYPVVETTINKGWFSNFIVL